MRRPKKFKTLEKILWEVDDIDSIEALCGWDQVVMMPAEAIEMRSKQVGTLSKTSHEKLTSVEMGKILDDLKPYEESLDYDSYEASLIRVTRNTYEDAVRVPPEFVEKFSKHVSQSVSAWMSAKEENDFSVARPSLETMLEDCIEYANFFPYDHIMDPLIDDIDQGMTVQEMKKIFKELKTELVPIVKRILSRTQTDNEFLFKKVTGNQLAFHKVIMGMMGFDFKRGRIDLSPHPFATGSSSDDIRVTTKIQDNDIMDGILSTIHETGHAMFDQNIGKEMHRTLLAKSMGFGLHESQSKLWEVIVGQSRDFLEFLFPLLCAHFPELKFDEYEFESFYEAVNLVEPSLVRIESDEVTYNLHVILRFELELAMLEGKLKVKDLRDAWNAKYKKYLGIEPENDREGILQDFHWWECAIGGMFQCYTIGNLLSVQFFNRALKDHPSIREDMKHGNFDLLRGWLEENIWKHGGKFSTDEMVKKATGRTMSVKPYISYLKKKYKIRGR